MPNRQKFIGNAEALIELLNDMLNDAFFDEISEENESDFDVKTDLDRSYIVVVILRPFGSTRIDKRPIRQAGIALPAYQDAACMCIEPIGL